MNELEVRRLGIDDDPPSLTPYQWAWDLQRELHADVADEKRAGVLLLLEHPSTYTAGRRTEPHERPLDGTPVVDVDRGGKITWHGPGQLVGYPIVRLPQSVYIVDYVRRLEEALIRTLAEFGIESGRVRGRSGVWLAETASKPERKIAAIGVRVARNTTMHGFALNVVSDLSEFNKIVPCGITDAGVTSIAEELTNPPTMTQVADVATRWLVELLAFEAYEQGADIRDDSRERASHTLGLVLPPTA